MSREKMAMRHGERKCVFYEAMMNPESEMRTAFLRMCRKHPEFAWSREYIILAELQYAKGNNQKIIQLLLQYTLIFQELEEGSRFRHCLKCQMNDMVSSLYQEGQRLSGRFAKAMLHLSGIDYSGSLTQKGMNVYQIQQLGKKQMYTLAEEGMPTAYEIVNAGYAIIPDCSIV